LNHVIAHEIVHARGGDELHDHGGIMTVGAPSLFDTFAPITLDLLRRTFVW
jgi:hypothetical protein